MTVCPATAGAATAGGRPPERDGAVVTDAPTVSGHPNLTFEANWSFTFRGALDRFLSVPQTSVRSAVRITAMKRVALVAVAVCVLAGCSSSGGSTPVPVPSPFLTFSPEPAPSSPVPVTLHTYVPVPQGSAPEPSISHPPANIKLPSIPAPLPT
jgi:hypothetical protein